MSKWNESLAAAALLNLPLTILDYIFLVSQRGRHKTYFQALSEYPLDLSLTNSKSASTVQKDIDALVRRLRKEYGLLTSNSSSVVDANALITKPGTTVHVFPTPKGAVVLRPVSPALTGSGAGSALQTFVEGLLGLDPLSLAEKFWAQDVFVVCTRVAGALRVVDSRSMSFVWEDASPPDGYDLVLNSFSGADSQLWVVSGADKSILWPKTLESECPWGGGRLDAASAATGSSSAPGMAGLLQDLAELGGNAGRNNADGTTSTRRSKVGDVDVEVVLEHQRLYPFFKWSTNLLPYDVYNWSDTTGKVRKTLTEVSKSLPSGWVWLDSWHYVNGAVPIPEELTSGAAAALINNGLSDVAEGEEEDESTALTNDVRGRTAAPNLLSLGAKGDARTDSAGWQYAMDFSSSHWYGEKGVNHMVRRRIWNRRRICKTTQTGGDTSPASPASPASLSSPDVIDADTDQATGRSHIPSTRAQTQTQIAYEYCFENQRFIPIRGWGRPVFPLDRATWSSEAGDPVVRDAVILPPGWTWADSWHLDPTFRGDELVVTTKKGKKAAKSGKGGKGAKGGKTKGEKDRRNGRGNQSAFADSKDGSPISPRENNENEEDEDEDEDEIDSSKYVSGGWQYAFDFKGEFTPKNSLFRGVRRRRWRRTRQRKMGAGTGGALEIVGYPSWVLAAPLIFDDETRKYVC